jgi:hypothetical protein
MDEIARRFVTRLHGLAASHDLLIEQGWQRRAACSSGPRSSRALLRGRLLASADRRTRNHAFSACGPGHRLGAP